MRLAASLWAGIASKRRQADEGPRHLRIPGVRLMPTSNLRRAPRAARDLFRPHGGRGLVAADLRRAGRPHPRDGARRARPDARHAARLAARRSHRPARARCRLRHRRAGGRGGASAAPMSSPSTSRPRWSASPASARRATSAPAASTSASATCSTRPRPLRPRRRDGLADPLPRAATSSACWPAWRRARTRSIVFTFAPRTPALSVMHAVGRLFPRGDRAPAIEPVGEARSAAR